jgi:hypothetical protein
MEGSNSMAKAKKSGEFSFKSTGVSYMETQGGGGANQVNLEGSATGYGTVLGTLTFYADAPGSQTGQTSWVGTAYLDNGDLVTGSGEGFFESSGKHKWRVRSVMRTSAGDLLLTDGVVSLDGRSYKGTLTRWE